MLVVAIEFDATHSVQEALTKSCVGIAQQDLSTITCGTTLAADGGPVMRFSTTLFAISVSLSVLRSETGSPIRTRLLPLLVMLSGEQTIHLALSERLWRGVKAVLDRRYVIPFVPREGAGIGSAMLRLAYLVRLCGDFAMQGHFLSISGGIHRCPCRWLCLSRRYMSLAAQFLAPAKNRDPVTLAMLWEMAAWGLARWCALRTGRWKPVGGRLTTRCRCGAPVVALSVPVGGALRCTSSTCDLLSGPPLQAIAYTPLSTAFTSIRRAFGGTRGYPLLRDLPYMV